MQGKVVRGAVVVAAALSMVVAAVAPAHAADPWPAPGTTVARIDGVTVDFATVERWARAMAPNLTPPSGAGPIRSDSACLRRGAAGARRPACARVRRALWRQALDWLLGMHLSVLEARRVPLDPADGRRPSAEPWDIVTPPRGLRGADRRLWLAGMEANQAWENAVRDSIRVDEAALVRFWRRQTEPRWFAPRQVRAEVLQLPTRAAADAALAAVRGGESFESAGARLTAASPAVYRGGRHLFSAADLIADEPGGSDTLAGALLEAQPGALLGPLRFGRAFFVARVVEVVTERARIPLAQMQDEVRGEVTEMRVSRRIAAEGRRVLQRWHSRTTCRRAIAPRRLCGRLADRL